MIQELPSEVLSFIRNQGYLIKVDDQEESISYVKGNDYMPEVYFAAALVISIVLSATLNLLFLSLSAISTVIYSLTRTRISHPATQIRLSRLDTTFYIKHKNGDVKEVPYENIQDFSIEESVKFNLAGLLLKDKKVLLKKLFLVTKRKMDKLEVLTFKTTGSEADVEVKRLLNYLRRATD